MTYITIKADEAKAEEIREYYQAGKANNPKNPYLVFQVRHQGVDISCYKKSKGDVYVISFQGEGEKVKEEASLFSRDLTIKEYDEKKKEKDAYSQGWEDKGYQIGSDETGKGEFFGPLIVTATYITPKDIPLLEKLGVTDSKKLTDGKIESIAPTLSKKIAHYTVMVSADKLSSSYDKNAMNTEKMLALCHNAAQAGLLEKYSLPSHIICYIDQFIPQKRYQAYVGDRRIENPLYFRTEGETYYPSVAAASVIARSVLLSQWKKMDQKFHTHIPIGSGANVDVVYQKLKKEYGDEVDKYVKRYFKNYSKTI